MVMLKTGKERLLTPGKGFVVDDFLTHIVVTEISNELSPFFHLTTPCGAPAVARVVAFDVI